MSLKASESGNSGGKFKDPPLLEPGSYPARIVLVVDLGLQAQHPYQGQTKDPKEEILVTYELLDEFMPITNEEGEWDEDDWVEDKERPRWFSENFASYPLEVDRAKSTKRYLSIDPDVVHQGDWSQLINLPVRVVLGNTPGKGKHEGRVFTNVMGVSAMRKKEAATAPQLVNESHVYEAGDNEVFGKLPKWIQEKIGNRLAEDTSPAQMSDEDIEHENTNPF